MNESAIPFLIPPQWNNLLREELTKPYLRELQTKVGEEYRTQEVFPQASNLFRALELCAPGEARVVILGQDPYHTPGVADGLAFSTHEGNPVPPSLKNIFKEIAMEYKTVERTSPDLTGWAKQGVLLLNASLTVSAGEANSHKGIGWEEFTDAVMRSMSDECTHVVFLLWGNDARKKRQFIDTTKHLVLESAHPSPLSAHKGFLGNGHFMTANAYLSKHGRGEVDWFK